LDLVGDPDTPRWLAEASGTEIGGQQP
jgi:hypothetical protein